MIFVTNPKKLGVSLSKLHLASLDEHKNDLIYENLMVLLGFSPWPNGVYKWEVLCVFLCMYKGVTKLVCLYIANWVKVVKNIFVLGLVV